MEWCVTGHCNPFHYSLFYVEYQHLHEEMWLVAAHLGSKTSDLLLLLGEKSKHCSSPWAENGCCWIEESGFLIVGRLFLVSFMVFFAGFFVGKNPDFFLLPREKTKANE